MANPYPLDPERDRYIEPLRDEEIEEDDPSVYDLFGDESEWDEQEDGSVIVKMESMSGPMQSRGFYDNLAEELSESDLQALSLKYQEYIERDKEARRKRDEQYEEGIRRSGLGNDAPGGATFNGASKVVHPVIAEACVDFEATIIKEVLPPDGPVKADILGDVNDAKVARSTRKAEFMNWQLKEQIEEFPDEIEQLFTQLPLGGSQYLKVWYDQTLKRPCVEFLPIDNVYLPYAAASFYTASRVTEVNDITKDTYEERVETGLYRDLDLFSPGLVPEQSKSEEASDQVEGREMDAYNEDGIRRVYHTYCWMRPDWDKKAKGRAPYILMLDESTHRVLGLYRNWEEGDKKQKKLDWIIEFRFIPWRGAYGIGLFHLIGSLAIALTGALRALMDSAHINNLATALKLRGDRVGGQSKAPDPTEIVEVEGPAGIDDVRKLAMPLPFNPPSPVLFQLLGWLTDAAKGVVTTAEEKIQDLNSQAPVGTTQALIEQGAKVFSAIHSRQHKSFKRFLAVLSRINRWFIDDMEQGDIVSDLEVRPEDFIRTTDVIPVSDPNIFSETQRFAQNSAVLQMAERNLQLQRSDFDMKGVYRRVLQQMRYPNYNQVLPDPKSAKEMNPALENVAMTLAQPVAAYPSQDHLAHIQVHLKFAEDPNFGSSPIMGPQFVPALMEHLKQHMTLWYLAQTEDYVQAATERPGDTHKVQSIFSGMQKVFAAAANHVHIDSQQAFAGVTPIIQKFAQMLAQQAQQQQMAQNADPNAQATLQASMAETNRRSQRDKGDLQLGQQKNQLEDKRITSEAQTKQADTAAKQQDTAIKAQSAQVDNQTKTAGLMIDAKIEEARDQREVQRSNQEMMNDQMRHQNDMERQQQETQHAAMSHAQTMAQSAENQAIKRQQALTTQKPTSPGAI